MEGHRTYSQAKLHKQHGAQTFQCHFQHVIHTIQPNLNIQIQTTLILLKNPNKQIIFTNA